MLWLWQDSGVSWLTNNSGNTCKHTHTQTHTHTHTHTYTHTNTHTYARTHIHTHTHTYTHMYIRTGAVAVAGLGVSWLTNNLGILESFMQAEELALTVGAHS